MHVYLSDCCRELLGLQPHLVSLSSELRETARYTGGRNLHVLWTHTITNQYFFRVLHEGMLRCTRMSSATTVLILTMLKSWPKSLSLTFPCEFSSASILQAYKAWYQEIQSDPPPMVETQSSLPPTSESQWPPSSVGDKTRQKGELVWVLQRTHM